MTLNRTAIQWTDFTVNPVRYRNADGLDVWACSKVSAGCTNCYAESLALSPRMVSKGRALGNKFNDAEMAKLTPYLDEAALRKMLTFKPKGSFRNGERPMVFVGDMTDVFGEWVPDEWLDRLFAVFGSRPDVDWQVLTKRPERMREYLAAEDRAESVGYRAMSDYEEGFPVSRAMSLIHAWLLAGENALSKKGMVGNALHQDLCTWPLPNVWLGTSVENQEAADQRIPELLATPAAVRFLSCEPLLGPLYGLDQWLGGGSDNRPFWTDRIAPDERGYANIPGIDWVIVGGESGTGARPCDIEWGRDIVRQCRAAGVAPFVKQLGSKPVEFYHGRSCNGAEWHGADEIKLKHNHGGNIEEWPEDLRVREFPVVAP